MYVVSSEKKNKGAAAACIVFFLFTAGCSTPFNKQLLLQIIILVLFSVLNQAQQLVSAFFVKQRSWQNAYKSNAITDTIEI